MISNRDSNNNLAREVQRKKMEMQAQGDKEKKRMMIAYIVIGSIAALLIGFAVFQMSGTEEKKVVDFDTPETDTDKYNSKLEALEAKQKRQHNANLLDVFSSEKKDTVATDSTAENKLRENIEQYNTSLDKKKTKPKDSKQKKTTSDDVYGDYSMWEDGEKQQEKASVKKTATTAPKEELTYEEKLRMAKEARYGKISRSNTESSPEEVETRIAIFRDQFLMPGELAEMVLTEDFTYNNKRFKKGTPVYGYININKSRVLFDIKNIAHHPLDIEVRDIRDGLVGMYSSRAGELWKKYEAEGLNDATEQAGNGITNNRLLSGSIDAISEFFKKKRLNKNDKIMLLNDQELIVYISNK